MREFIVIFAVIGILLALTAVRYRKQIAGMIHVYRMLRSAREHVKSVPEAQRSAAASKLVSCAKCGTWTPESTAIRMAPTTFYCSTKCVGH